MAKRRKLIEVALPLEVINRESARENYIYRGNPSAIHKWWSQKPLATTRAVIFAQLVDDPSSHPDRFPTEEAQTIERERLHSIIERLVVWETINDEAVLSRAREEILKSTAGAPPPLIDPFAGGGTIPLEAQRLGLETQASDLNPVAVLISKALIEFPPKFGDRAPVFPGAAEQRLSWTGAEGLAEDVRRYGAWMRDEAARKIGHLYPKVDGKAVIAWIWARTVTCPNPACGIKMPLTSKWWLGKRKGKEAYIVADVHNGEVRFTIGRDPSSAPEDAAVGTIGRQGGVCIGCQSAVELSYIRAEGKAGRMGVQLMAVAADGQRRRDYYPPDAEQLNAADIEKPEGGPDVEIPPGGPAARNVPLYGLTRFSDLFTNRQLAALMAFSDLVSDAREKVLADTLATGRPEGARLDAGGTEAAAYADVISTYLAFVISKITDYVNSLSGWYPQEDRPTHLFTSQAIPLIWDFAELNPLSDVGGAWSRSVKLVSEALEGAPGRGCGVASQADAAAVSTSGRVISTDPPYYNAIGYSDLSDFFYVWLRRTLHSVYPDLLSTVLVPKAEELVANPYRHDGKAGAKTYFESGFQRVFSNLRSTAIEGYPMTLYYAHKQAEGGNDGQPSSGWETLLQGMVHSGWQITATWPLRSERSGRMISVGRNALASSIVLALRPRPVHASATDRPGFIAALKDELGEALDKLQAGGIAPVDLPQAAIGPGMAVFSRYSAVREFDGSQMSVRSALALINEMLDEVLSEQEGDFDPATRFCIAWYRQHGYVEGKYGDAELLGNARGIAVDTLKRHGVLHSAAGKVRLFRPSDLPEDYDVLRDDATSDWEALHHLIRVLEADGVDAAGAFLAQAGSRADGAVHPDLLPELAHLLFRVSEDNKWTKEAISFNQLVTAWTDIHTSSRAAASATPTAVQEGFDFSG